MKNTKNILKKNQHTFQQKLRPLMILLTIFFVENSFSMVRPKSSLPLETKQKTIKTIMARHKQLTLQNQENSVQKELANAGWTPENIQKELMDAGWSQEKIVELRLRYPSDSQKEVMRDKGLTLEQLKELPLEEYSSGYIMSDKYDSPGQKILNNILINHYAQKIYAALETVPVDERWSWTGNLGSILRKGLNGEGDKKYLFLTQPVDIERVHDGSEIGIVGMKYQALMKVREETNIEAIPLINGVKITPTDFFKKLLEPESPEEVATEKMGLENAIKQKQIQKQQKSQNQKQKQLQINAEKQQQELKNTFMSDEELNKQLMLERENQYQPNECLIYEKGTSKGILITKDDLKYYSEFAQNMFESMDSLPDEIALDFSSDVIKVVFGESTLETLSWNQLVDCIKCYDYLLLKNIFPSGAYYRAMTYWVNEIGNKILDLTEEMATSYKKETKGRSIEAIENNLPDYTIFKLLKAPLKRDTFVNNLKQIKNSFLQRYIKFYEKNYYGKNKNYYDKNNKNKWSEFDLYKEENPVLASLDIAKKAFDLEKKDREDFENNAKKWFW